METIVALATARGRAGVAIIRVSGTRAWDVCQALVGRVPKPRKAQLSILRDNTGAMIDQALVLIFDEGASFTGERVCEFQVHGSTAVVSALLKACLAVDGVRIAEPGEFTRRAFLAGRMDLTEVEALADLIDAETEGQRQQAMRVLDGSAGHLVDRWRDDLLQSLSMLEAALDFADEELPDDLFELVREPMERVRSSILAQIDGRNAAESLRDGFDVAIVGRVNAGKSTLLNALAGRDAAITSERAGTTRDVIEVRMEIGGLSVTLIDTAGLREADDEIERIGIERGIARARAADLRIYLKDSPEEMAELVHDDDIVVLSKADLWSQKGISAKTGEGLSELMQSIEAKLQNRVNGSSVFMRARHFDKLQRAAECLERAVVRSSAKEDAWELASEEVRLALRCLDGIVGRVDAEDVLGRIFSSFCIGK